MFRQFRVCLADCLRPPQEYFLPHWRSEICSFGQGAATARDSCSPGRLGHGNLDCLVPSAERLLRWRSGISGPGRSTTGLVWARFVHVARCVSASYRSPNRLSLSTGRTQNRHVILDQAIWDRQSGISSKLAANPEKIPGRGAGCLLVRDVAHVLVGSKQRRQNAFQLNQGSMGAGCPRSPFDPSRFVPEVDCVCGLTLRSRGAAAVRVCSPSLEPCRRTQFRDERTCLRS